jgi:hypothetical protein
MRGQYGNVVTAQGDYVHEHLSLRVLHGAGAQRGGRNGEVLISWGTPRQAKTGVSNGAAGARLRVWFWTRLEQKMVA